MNQPIFVQLANQTIDVSKFTHIVHRENACGVTLHFVGGSKQKISRAEAVQLMDVIKQLDAERKLIARMAPPPVTNGVTPGGLQ